MDTRNSSSKPLEECPTAHPEPVATTGTHLSHTDKERIIKAHLARKRPKVIAEIMDLPVRRVEHIIRTYAKTGRIPGRNHVVPVTPSTVTTTVRQKLEETHLEMLRIWTSEDASQSVDQLTKRLNETFKTNFSVPLVQRSLGTFLFSISRICDSPDLELRNDPETLNLRREFALIHNDLPSLYDETEITYFGHTTLRLSIRDRADKQDKTLERNISICVALNAHQLIGYIAQLAPVSHDQFLEFLETIIDAHKERGIASGVTVMDENCASDIDALNDLVLGKGFTNIFLPPFSSFLNPTEVLFDKFRSLFTAIKTEVTSETQLVDIILDGTQLVEVIDCPLYMETVQSHLPKCLNLEPVVDLHTIYAEACTEEEQLEECVGEES